MCAAFTASLKAGNYDAYLLFNDDVELFPETANAMIEEFVARNLTTPVIYVGSTLSTSTGQTTYSAFRETSRIKALGFHAIGAVSANTDCDTFNGNFVLVPGDFFRDIGGLDPIFHHGLGDIDLGLVAREAGIRSILYGTAVGTCEKGPEMRERLSRASFSQRLRLLFCAPNGVAPYRHFVWKHRPKLLFPLYLCVHVSKKLVSLFRSGAS
jgi:GT2 family glycosyltransferase